MLGNFMMILKGHSPSNTVSMPCLPNQKSCGTVKEVLGLEWEDLGSISSLYIFYLCDLG